VAGCYLRLRYFSGTGRLPSLPRSPRRSAGQTLARSAQDFSTKIGRADRFEGCFTRRVLIVFAFPLAASILEKGDQIAETVSGIHKTLKS
jgi:hypothetical protein